MKIYFFSLSHAAISESERQTKSGLNFLELETLNWESNGHCCGFNNQNQCATYRSFRVTIYRLVSNREYRTRRLNSLKISAHIKPKKKATAHKKYKIWRNRAKIEAVMGSTSRWGPEVWLTGLTNHMEVIELKRKQLSDQICLPHSRFLAIISPTKHCL